MTISGAINRLLELQRKHGDVEVYADCPTCGASFRCGVVVTVSTHLTADAVDPSGASNAGKLSTRAGEPSSSSSAHK